MDTREPLLKINDLSLGFSQQHQEFYAVNNFNLTLHPGKIYALLGESGCGKSMTALALMQLLPQAIKHLSGSINFAGRDLAKSSERSLRDIRGDQIAMIFQEPMTALNPVLTVGEQIIETLRRHQRLDKVAATQKALTLLDEVGIADAKLRLKEYPHQLSGGMKQRIMIAIALACDPVLLIADEPTTALDVTIGQQVLRLIKKLQQEKNTCVLFITHDLGVARQLADEILVMYNGYLVEAASSDQFFKAPAHPYSKLLMQALPGFDSRDRNLAAINGFVELHQDARQGCRFHSRCPLATEICQQQDPALALLEIGHRVRCHFAKEGIDDLKLMQRPAAYRFQAARVQDAHTLLSVNHLQVHFPIKKGLFKRTRAHLKAVDDISFDINVGKTLALVGESGCGKSTLARTIVQLNQPTAGEIIYDGHNLATLNRHDAQQLRSDIQMIFQDPYSSMDPKCDIASILSEGMDVFGYYSEPRARRQRLLELLNQVGLPAESLHRYPHEFSGGQRQRIAIARALAVEPKLIVCDEPTSALDVSVQAQILNLLKKLQRELCISYLFISHDISVVSYLANDIAIMYLGKIVERGKVEEILFDAKHPYTQTLLSAVPDVKHKALPTAARDIHNLEIPSPVNPPAGCYFHPRCTQCMAQCRQQYPDTVKLSASQSAACYLYS